MAGMLARRERHGWSWVELSRRTGKPVWKLRWWHRRLAENPGARPGWNFRPVQVVEGAVSVSSRLELVLPSGVRILVPADFDPGHLQRVIATAGRGC